MGYNGLIQTKRETLLGQDTPLLLTIRNNPMMTSVDYQEQAQATLIESSSYFAAIEAEVARIKANGVSRHGQTYQPGNTIAYKPLPASTCGQCEHFYQGKVSRAKGTPWGYCPLLDTERRMSDKPCKLYKEDLPF